MSGGGKTFVGPADDPFFVDLGAIFDGINIDKPGRPTIGLGNQGGGKDDVSTYNMHSFVLQVPEAEVTRDHKPVVRPWCLQRRRRRVGLHGARARLGGRATTARAHVKRHWVQVSRLGNPLINEVIIPISQKDKFNARRPRTTRRTSASTPSTRSRLAS